MEPELELGFPKPQSVSIIFVDLVEIVIISVTCDHHLQHMSIGFIFTFQYCFCFHHNFPHVFSSSPVREFHFHFPILLSLSSQFPSCIFIVTCPCAEFLRPCPATGSWTELGIVPLMQIFTLAPWEINDMVHLHMLPF